MSSSYSLQKLILLNQKLKGTMHKSFRAFAHKHGLKPQEVMVLMALDQKRSMTVGDFVDEFSMHQANVSTLCKQLLDKNLVVKTQDPKDIRSFDFTLSDEASVIISKVKEDFKTQYASMESSIDVHKIQEGIQELIKLIEGVQ